MALPGAARPGEGEIEMLLEQRTVGEVGERVVVGEVGDLELGPPPVGDVLARSRHSR